MTQVRLPIDDPSTSGPAASWRESPRPPEGLARQLDLPELHARLLHSRGITAASEVEPFLRIDERLWHEPFLIPDMDRAVATLIEAVDRDVPVAVYGDFDVDGITGTAILCRTIAELGGRAVPYIPSRMAEGHGLHEAALRRLAADGAGLLVTVDCGTTALAELELAASLGLDAIVTDHHTAPEGVPAGVPVLNPSLPGGYPDPGLTGAGVALKLAEAALGRAGLPQPGSLIELACLGTVADVAPLTGENRFIVGRGLASLRATDSVGLRALAERSRTDLPRLSARDLSFRLIPRLNAAGRLDDPDLSLRLLAATDAAEAAELAEQLEGLNSERRRFTDRGMAEAEEMVERLGLSDKPALVVYSPKWHPGVIGLIAARLSERYGRPAVAAGLVDGLVRASARGPEGYGVMDAISATGLPFTRRGGHAAAAGFTLEEQHFSRFADAFPALVADASPATQAGTELSYECEIGLSEVSDDNYSFIQSLAPFGEGNPAPHFLTKGVQVVDRRVVGRNRSHLKLQLVSGGVHLNAIAFGMAGRESEAAGSIDLIYSIDLNEWNGRRRLDLKVADFRPSA